jgi:hypothetical protein
MCEGSTPDPALVLKNAKRAPKEADYKSAKSVAVSNTWTCPSCTFVNPPGANKCNACRHPAPDPAPVLKNAESVAVSNGWDCPSCTFVNPPGANKCNACRRPAPDSALVSEDAKRAQVAADYNLANLINETQFTQEWKDVRSRAGVGGGPSSAQEESDYKLARSLKLLELFSAAEYEDKSDISTGVCPRCGTECQLMPSLCFYCLTFGKMMLINLCSLVAASKVLGLPVLVLFSKVLHYIDSHPNDKNLQLLRSELMNGEQVGHRIFSVISQIFRVGVNIFIETGSKEKPKYTSLSKINRNAYPLNVNIVYTNLSGKPFRCLAEVQRSTGSTPGTLGHWVGKTSTIHETPVFTKAEKDTITLLRIGLSLQ